jgi:hypothetical protein
MGNNGSFQNQIRLTSIRLVVLTQARTKFEDVFWPTNGELAGEHDAHSEGKLFAQVICSLDVYKTPPQLIRYCITAAPVS